MKKYYTGLTITLCFLFMGTQLANSQTKADQEIIKAASNVKALQNLQNTLSQKNLKAKAEAIKIAKEKGWLIKGTLENGTYVELMRVENGKPVYYQTYNINASKSTRAYTLNSGGLLGLDLDGQNMKVYVWDGGHARTTHKEYDGPGGYNRVSVKDSPYETHYHSGHVMGTILGYGYDSDAKGMAPEATGYSYEWTDDDAEASTAASNGMILSNHSYGYKADLINDQYFGAYISESRVWDQIMYNAPYYLMVVAAGNDGGSDNYNDEPLDGYSAYDKLSGHSTSKNNMVVGNAEDVSIDYNGNISGTVSRNYSSSEGPTDDYRIKPDIMGNGTGVYSSAVDSDTDYKTLTGTSMASPNVCGTLVLLQQHYKNKKGSLMRAASLKGLALHTADDVASTGPDATTGWGLMNAKKAAQTISGIDNTSIIRELTLSSGQTYTTTVNASGSEDLKVSISWTDPAGNAVSATNSHTPVLVNDLDLRVEKSYTTYYPWRLTGVTTNDKGDNEVDPFERVDLSNASGTYTITVSHEGSLSGSSQDFTLIVTGVSGSSSDNEPPTNPSNLSSSNITSQSVELNWTASSDNVAVSGYEIYKDGALEKTVSTNSAIITGLSASTTYTFKVRAYDAEKNYSGYSNQVSVTTEAGSGVSYCTSYGEDVSDEYIGNVSFGDINNNSDGSEGGYGDYTHINANVEKEQTYNISVSKEWSGTQYNETVRAWIDYNMDGDFDDAGELVLDSPSSKTTPVTASVTIPSSAKKGLTRMRVILRYSTSASPCGKYNYGETEDYSINITGNGGGDDTQAPTAPSNLTASNIQETTVDLSWSASTDNVGVEGYEVYNNGSSIGTTSSTQATIEGLTADTEYTFYVKAYDAAGNKSANSNSVNITTTGGPNPVDYCELKGNNSSYEWIDYVEIGSMTNSTGSDNGYGDYTHKVGDLSYGNNTIYISAAFSGSSYTENWYIWIDYNKDGIFSSSELVADGSSSSSSNLSAEFSVPNSALSGQTRMRIAMKYNSSTESCGSFNYGEVEDYTINIGSNYYNQPFANSESTSLSPGHNSGFNVFPNPVTNGFLNIKTEFNGGIYEIYNINGSLIESNNFHERNIKINIKNLTSGKYIIKVKSENRSKNASFIVQ